MPVIGVLNTTSPGGRAHILAAFQQGVREAGFVEGRNVAIEYRWAQDQYVRLPDLATDLARRAAVIAAHDTPSAIAAKAATSTIPIVFASGGDPVKLGLVASLNRPGGNVTGVTFLLATLAAKLFGLLHELLPRAERIAVLVDPKFSSTEPFVTDVRTAAWATGKKVEVLNASSSGEIDAVFTSLKEKLADALLIGPGRCSTIAACSSLR
jgi:putative ABC transport system substrate-binding protein